MQEFMSVTWAGLLTNGLWTLSHQPTITIATLETLLREFLLLVDWREPGSDTGRLSQSGSDPGQRILSPVFLFYCFVTAVWFYVCISPSSSSLFLVLRGILFLPPQPFTVYWATRLGLKEIRRAWPKWQKDRSYVQVCSQDGVLLLCW